MDLSDGNRQILGLLTLFGFFLSVHAQCDSLLHCENCNTNTGGGGLQCLTCEEGYAQSEGATGCCSRGCSLDQNSFHLCNTSTGKCTYGCRSGFIGDTCVDCKNVIERCEDCKHLEDDKSRPVHCITCATDFYPTTNKQQCCPMGCDSCNGQVCTSCKSSYFLYNDGCDTCGNNCKPPSDGSARCDSVSGECNLGCLEGWHGLQCNVFCDLSRCDQCTYDIPRQNLTCLDCEAGYYGPYCGECNSNCGSTGNSEICMQDGTCLGDCEPGYRGNKCDVACDAAVGLGNCAECDRYQFTCTVCKPGYWGNTCQNSCNTNCVTFNGERRCSLDKGSCDFGCLAGYYKDDCSGSCPNCLTNVCNRDTGDCRDPFCDPGFHGSNCNFTCPANCANDPDNNEASCHFNYGNCTHGCIDGKWGQFCNQGCSINCAASSQGTESGPQCQQSNGVCLHTCKSGFYEETCTRPCKSQCVDNNCDIHQGTCLECNATNPGYLCPSGSCYCVNGTCNRSDGSCECWPYAYGDKCQFSCSNCLDGSCSFQNGLCSSGCEIGFHGIKCQKSCSSNCESCDQDSGYCIDCRKGLKGAVCVEKCSKGCKDDKNGFDVCERYTGICSLGCETNLYGDLCDRRCDGCMNGECVRKSGACVNGCKQGTYGYYCEHNCSIGCVGNCNSYGVCEFGCKQGWIGALCDTECSHFCDRKMCNLTGECTRGCVSGHFGPFCEYVCPENCLFNSCSKVGKCVDGCIIGFYGDTCTNRCLQPCANLTCDRKLGTCKQTYNDAQVAPKEADPELSLEGIIGISIGAVVVVIIFVIVIVCCINYKRRYDDAKTEIHLPSDVIERLSTHRSLHSTTSTNYPVARVVGDDNEKDFVLF